MKKLVVLLALAVGVISLISINPSSASADSYPANCGTSAVVKCGAYNQAQLNTGIQSQAGTGALYSKLGTGTNLANAKYGIVYPDGKVTVGGKTVATGAMTFGRVKRASTDQAVYAGGVTFWKHSITGAAIYKPVDAHVFLNSNGQFTGAIIKMCGNPVVATPVPVPPKPQPKPQAIACTALTMDQKDVDRRYVKVTLTGSASNTSLSGYRIDFGDGTVVNQKTAEHTYAKAGNYTITGYVSGSVDGKVQTVTANACKQAVTFEEEEKPVETLVCSLLKIDEKDNEKRYVKVTLTGSASNTTISSYRINFGDGTIVNEQTAEHTYAEAGSYTITGHVTGTVDGKEVTVSDENCVQEINFTKPEVLPAVTTMPETGAAGALAMFTGVSAVGAAAHRFITTRRFKK